MALVNYRGFGPSTGTPSQAHVFADRDADLRHARTGRPDVDPRRIVAMGYSLGTGVFYLAEQRPVVGTILGRAV